MNALTNDSNRSGNDGQEGYTFSYCCGDYRTSSSFDDRDCMSVLSNIANFLLGCGFSPNNVIDCMAETAESLDAAWRDSTAPAIDPAIMRKWDLYEAAEDA